MNDDSVEVNWLVGFDNEAIKSLMWQNVGDVYADYTFIKRNIIKRDSEFTYEEVIFCYKGEFYAVECRYDIGEVRHFIVDGDIAVYPVKLREDFVVKYERS